jgi:hypothetical protein
VRAARSKRTCSRAGDLGLEEGGEGLEEAVLGVVGDADLEVDPALAHAGEVADPAGEEVVVGEDQFLAAEAAEDRAAQADSVDGAALVADGDRVAGDEGLVEGDRDGGEDVAEHALDGEGDGDAADAEAGDEGGDVDAEGGEDGEQDHRPDGDHAGEAQEGLGDGDDLGVAAAGVVGEAAVDEVADQGGGPDAGLQHAAGDEGDLGAVVPALGEVEDEGGEAQGEQREEPPAGALDELDEEVVEVARGLAGERAQAAGDQPAQEDERRGDDQDDRQRDGPLGAGGAEPLAREQGFEAVGHRGRGGGGQWVGRPFRRASRSSRHSSSERGMRSPNWAKNSFCDSSSWRHSS